MGLLMLLLIFLLFISLTLFAASFVRGGKQSTDAGLELSNLGMVGWVGVIAYIISLIFRYGG
jgi:hypothetical protein